MPDGKKPARKIRHPKIQRPRPRTWDPRAWLDEFRRSKSITGTSKHFGIACGTAYRYRQVDDEFAAEWDDICLERDRELEDSLFLRAVNGYEEPVWREVEEWDERAQQVLKVWKIVGTIRKYETALLIFALKAAMPHRYVDRIQFARWLQQSGVTVEKLAANLEAQAALVRNTITGPVEPSSEDGLG